jgi:uncharacterized oxidoreductase
MRMTGNTMLVTGGTRGIGRALAEAFHDRGNRVIITGRHRPLLDDLTAARPGIVGLVLDVDDPASPDALARDVEHRFPALNVVIANAGISKREDLARGWNTADAEALIATNILGTLRTIAAFLPMLQRRDDSALLVTSSKLAVLPAAAFPTYCATKAFLHSWLQSCRYQLRATGVEILELLPPYVATELTGPQQAADPRAMPLDAFIAEVMQLLAAGEHPRGEIVVERARADRVAERDGRYDAAFAAVNPP